MVTDIIRLVVTHNAGEVNEGYSDLSTVRARLGSLR
jgi:hypothetical protein